MLEIEKQVDITGIILSIKGRIDTNNASVFASVLQEGCRELGKGTLFIDCKHLEYMSSAGLRLLLTTRKQVNEGQLKLINVTDLVYEILSVTGFDSFLEVERLAE